MNICIIGKNSYIGNHIDGWLSAAGHDVFQLDVLNDDWRLFDFSPYDAIIHVAGIVHRPDCNDEELYRRVNTELPIDIARRFKESGTRPKTFVFLSTMAVFGVHKRLKKNVITAETPLSPTGLYGKSKKEAEDGLKTLQSENFDVVIIRPPNVYGNGCKGGYISGFAKVANKLPLIPKAYTEVRQSVIYIDNLCELIRLLIEHRMKGIFMPQDDKAVSAIEIIEAIAGASGKRVRTSRLLGLAVRMGSFISLIKKAYGGVEYARQLSEYEGLAYRVASFEEAIKRTVK